MSASNAGRIGVWGASGSGKSAYVKRRIKGTRRLIVFDPLAEYPKGQRVVACSSVDAIRKAMLSNYSGFRLALVPTPGREAAYLNQLCGLILLAQRPYADGAARQGLTLVVEEMNLSFPLNGAETKCPKFAEICSRGRHYGIEVIGVSQRIAEVATRFRGNCTETVILRQQGANDRRAAAETTGLDPARIAALKNLQFLACRAGEVQEGQITF